MGLQPHWVLLAMYDHAPTWRPIQPPVSETGRRGAHHLRVWIPKSVKESAMRKIIIALVTASLLVLAMVSTALANPPTPACNGLDVAHGQVHSSGTQGELTLHGLRDENHNHCDH